MLLISRLLILATAAVCIAPTAAAQTLSDLTAVATELKSELAGGHWVGEGKFGYFENHHCDLLVPIVGHCYGANPASPYGMFFVPQAPGEYRDPRYQFMADVLGHPDLWPAWRLRSDEAIVFIGLTPPQHTYFGFRSYLYSSRSLNLLTPDVSPADFVLNESQDPNRRDIFSALGTSINNKTIAASNSTKANAATVIILTANSAVDSDLRQRIDAILARRGLPRNIVNTDKIPTDLVKVGYGANADDFMMLARAAYPADPVAAAAYRQSPPAVILRIVPKAPAPIIARSQYKWQTIPERRSGWTEDHLKSAQAALADAVVAKLQTTTRRVSARYSGTKLSMFTGDKCIKGNYGCWADNFDTTYDIGEAQSLPGSPNDLIVVIGVNHKQAKSADGTRTGKATYTSLVAYNFSKFMGVESRRDTDFAGSVDSYLPYVQPSPGGVNPVAAVKDQLYVQIVARDCTGITHCMKIPFGDAGIAANEELNLMVRAYLNPETTLGPDYSEILAPIYVRFRGE